MVTVRTGDPFSDAFVGSPFTAIYLLVVILIVLRINMARRSELVLLANLGISFLDVSLLVAAEWIALEAVARITFV